METRQRAGKGSVSMKELKDWTIREIKEECEKATICTEQCLLAYIDGQGSICCSIDKIMNFDEAPYMWELGDEQ